MTGPGRGGTGTGHKPGWPGLGRLDDARVSGPAWSSAAGVADWIGLRLLPRDKCRVTSVLPAGFEAYARVLHPAEEPFTGERVVRWAEVAAWSGQPLRRDAQFHSIALPPVRPSRAHGPAKDHGWAACTRRMPGRWPAWPGT